VNGKATQEEKPKVAMSLSTSSTSSNTSTSAAPASTSAPEVCVHTHTYWSICRPQGLECWFFTMTHLQEKTKEKASSDGAELSLNMSLQQAKELAHKKRSNKRAPQMEWSKRNELFSNLWVSFVPPLFLLPIYFFLISSPPSLIFRPTMPLCSFSRSFNSLAHN